MLMPIYSSSQDVVQKRASNIGTFPPNVDKYGPLNVPIEHHPTIRYMVYNGYYKVMSNIPKMGHLPTPDKYG